MYFNQIGEFYVGSLTEIIFRQFDWYAYIFRQIDCYHLVFVSLPTPPYDQVGKVLFVLYIYVRTV